MRIVPFFALLCALAAIVAPPVAAQAGEQISRVTGQAWPLAGPATASSTGLAYVEPGRWRHAAVSAAEVGGLADRCLSQVDDLQAASLSLDHETGSVAPFTQGGGTPSVYVTAFWVCARAPHPANVAALGSREAIVQTLLPAGSPGELVLRLNSPGGELPDEVGLTPFIRSQSGDDQALAGAGPDASLGSFTSRPVIGLNRWVQVALALKSGPDGWFAVFVNGQVVSRRIHLDTSEATAAQLSAAWRLEFPAWQGVVFQIRGLESWRGEDWPGFTDCIQSPVACDTAYRWPVRFVDGGAGAPWRSGGTALASTRPYGGGPDAPWRSRLEVNGIAGDQFWMETSSGPGDLPYNDDGWTTVCLPMLRFSTAAGGWTLKLMAPDGSIRLQAALAQGSVHSGSTDVPTLPGDKRWALCLHLHRDGAAAVSAINMSDDINLGDLHPAAFSALLSNWNAGPVKSIRLEAAFTGTATAETDGASLHRWLTVALCDSYSSTLVPGLVPPFYAPYRELAGAYSSFDDAASPGHFAKYGLVDGPAWQPAIALGRPGRTMMAWNDTMYGGMASARGVRYLLLGGIANDIGACGTEFPVQWVVSRDVSAISGLAASMPSRASRLAWLLPPFGTGENFTGPSARGCFDSIVGEAIANMSEVPAVRERCVIAGGGPVPLPDGGHYGVNAPLAAAYAARSWAEPGPSGAVPCGVADVGQAGGLSGYDGAHDSNDFVVFINLFFASSLRADLGGRGGAPSPDGELNNDDFIVFINAFFTECAGP